MEQANAASRGVKRGLYGIPLRIRIGLQLAACHERASSRGAAIAELQEVLELSTKSYRANAQLGRIYLQLSKPQRALRYLTAAAKLRPSDPAARLALKRVCGKLPAPGPACR